MHHDVHFSWFGCWQIWSGEKAKARDRASFNWIISSPSSTVVQYSATAPYPAVLLCTEDKIIIHKFRGEHFLWNRNWYFCWFLKHCSNCTTKLCNINFIKRFFLTWFDSKEAVKISIIACSTRGCCNWARYNNSQ